MSTPLIRPVTPEHRVTSGYGWRTLNGKRQFHDGIDYIGSDYRVHAICDGTVIKDFDDYDPRLRWTDGRHSAGNYVVIRSKIHGVTIFHRYVHLRENRVGHGQQIKQGFILGLYADAGYSFGAHLHFDMYDETWNKIDPTPIMLEGLRAAGLI